MIIIIQTPQYFDRYILVVFLVHFESHRMLSIPFQWSGNILSGWCGADQDDVEVFVSLDNFSVRQSVLYFPVNY